MGPGDERFGGCNNQNINGDLCGQAWAPSELWNRAVLTNSRKKSTIRTILRPGDAKRIPAPSRTTRRQRRRRAMGRGRKIMMTANRRRVNRDDFVNEKDNCDNKGKEKETG